MVYTRYNNECGHISNAETDNINFVQIGDATSGFGYNGEYYNAATGQIYLRARFYEPEMNRFSQKDIVRGDITVPASLNRYSYVQNDPVNFIDPSGESWSSVWSGVKSAAKSVVNTVKTTVNKVTTAVKNTANKVVNTVKSAAKSVANTVKNVVSNIPKNTTSTKSTSNSYSGSSGGNSGGGSSGGTYTEITAWRGYGSSKAVEYYTSSYETGKIPSTNAPRVEDIVVDDVFYCEKKDKQNSNTPVLAQQQIDALGLAKDLLLGAAYTVGRNGIDFVASLATFIAPNKAHTIERNTDNWKEWLETNTRNLASNDIHYDMGMLVGDVATVAIEWYSGVKLAKGLDTLAKNGPAIFNQIISGLSSITPSLSLAGGGVTAAEAAGAIATSGAGSKALVLFADILFNANAFKEDFDQLKENVIENENTPQNEIKFGSDVKSEQKLSNQMEKRGWTKESVLDTVDSPYTTRKSTNKATGNSATVYYTEDGSYVIVDDITKEIVQVSDSINPASWIPDSSIIDPFLP